MICTNCKKTIPDDAEFCKYCGTPAPFSFGVNYHPETLFNSGVGGGSDSESGTVEKALTDMEGRLNQKLSELSSKSSPQRDLWRKIQVIATALLALGLIVGAIMLVKINAGLNQINGELGNVMLANSEMKSSQDNLAQIQEPQEEMQANPDALLGEEQADEATHQEPASPDAYMIRFHFNYDNSGDSEGLEPATVYPGDVFSFASLDVPARDGYVFTGWNTTSDGGGTQYARDDLIGYFGYDVELYAQWEEADIELMPADNPRGF